MRAVLTITCFAVVICGTFACSSSPQVRFQPTPVKESARFAREVVDKEVVTVGDGVAAILILIDRYEPNRPFEEQMEILIQQGVIGQKERTKLKDSDTLTRGTLAFLITGALETKGGLTMRIFGRSNRYALRECIDCGIIEKGSAGSAVSGRELISVLSNAESYTVRNGGTH